MTVLCILWKDVTSATMETEYMENKTNWFVFNVCSCNVKPRALLFEHYIKESLKLH